MALVNSDFSCEHSDIVSFAPDIAKFHSDISVFVLDIAMFHIDIFNLDFGMGRIHAGKFEDSRSVELDLFVTAQYTEGNITEGKTYLINYCEPHKTAYRIVPVK